MARKRQKQFNPYSRQGRKLVQRAGLKIIKRALKRGRCPDCGSALVAHNGRMACASEVCAEPTMARWSYADAR